ncbi:energy-coupling factor transporter transmembrane component T [Corynebacterium freiburgense]|uniref:energy-coupling factor transporter transmembrane component T n=1 Tax=Corynebacterium freiburgense TaxID=556548 RepID=UPI0003F96C5A|nr:energy-coupling factor transporter transmembrane component T [Corynebacterium freiburgense]WJZ02121.1 Cobalt transport protein [Corynebacterium freiburgense]
MSPDPRTALITLIGFNCLALSYGPLPVIITIAVITFALFTFIKRIKAAIIFGLIFALFLGAFLVLKNFGGITGTLGFMFFWFTRFTVSIGIGVYTVMIIQSGKLIAALRSIHTPQWLVIPIAVVMRMFPIIAQEAQAIREAMLLRGLQPGFIGTLTHPLQHGELVIVPLISTVVRAGDELAAAALVRGLGSDIKPTSITPLKFGPLDIFLLLILIALTLLTFGVLP